MTSLLTLFFTLSAIGVLASLVDSGVRWWNAVGDALQARAAALRAEPEVSGIASIAIAGEVA